MKSTSCGSEPQPESLGRLAYEIDATPDFNERTNCPVCDTPARSSLFACRFAQPPIRDYLFNFYPGFNDDDLALLGETEYVLEKCAACSLIWQRFAPGPVLLARLYGEWAAAAGGLERHDNIAFQRAAVEEILLVLELVGRPPSAVWVLDFGMGWGRWPRLAAALGCHAAGVEIGAEQAEFAAQHDVAVLTLDTLPNAAFDFINSEQVFEHLTEPVAVATRLASSLKPEGWLKIGVPDGSAIERRLRSPSWAAPKGSRDSLNAVAPLEHLNCFTRRSLDMLAAQAGLERADPPAASLYSTTVGIWPPRRLVRAIARPPARRRAPGLGVFRRASPERA